jgi:hypothetical protein
MAKTIATVARPEGRTRTARLAFQRANGAVIGAHMTNETAPRAKAQFSSRRAVCSTLGNGALAFGAS